ncbi:MAG: ABC transporter permease [Reichenbachiella sp.]|uniref:ABC transporter permease n=1 Tax=Reichenbachiella sp. TaxID=2184521 RepID=UPI003267F71A
MDLPDPSSPPRFADYFLKWFCKKELLEEIKGDLHEIYELETQGMPGWRAALFYWIQVINFLRPFAIHGHHSKHTIMILNHIKFAKRNLIKHKISAFLNILSLSIGIACFTFIFVYLHSELSYDRFHKQAELIYRVPIDFVDSKNNRIPDATTPPALAPALLRDFPEVASAVRLFPNWGAHFRLGTEDGRQFFESDLIRTDSTFFDVFSFPVLHGDQSTALNTPDKIVLTRKMAIKYFGKEDAVGEKILLIGAAPKTFLVSAVLADLPTESHFQFGFLTRIDFERLEQNWGWYNFYTYIKMHPASDLTAFESKLQPFYEGYIEEEQENYNQIYTQPLTSIHLYSHLKWELQANGDINSIRIFSVLAIFVLLVSCLNYVNLTMAQSVRRFKEVGVRKVFGANKYTLIGQFIVETLLTASIALFFGFLLTEAALTNLNPLLSKQLTLLDPDGTWLIIIISGVVLLLGILAGMIPAYHLSTYQVALAVKGIRNTTGQPIKKMRYGLLIVQFAISALMILGVLVVQKQLNFMKGTDKGFEPDQVLIIENGREIDNFQTLKNELLKISEIQSVSNASGVLGRLNWTTSVGYPDPFIMNYVAIDADFIETMGFELQAGRAFSKDMESDKHGYNLMVNEVAFEELGLKEEDLGQTIPVRQDGDSIIYGTVLGVLKDFQYTDLKMKTKPFAFFYREESLDYISIKMQAGEVADALSSIERAWDQISGGAPIDYFFLDHVFDELILEEQRLGQLMFGLTMLSFFIAFIGMFSIANMTLKDRNKEIAIRKVLGSTAGSVVKLITGKFLWLVLIANLVSTPIAFILANRWLESFSYRTSLGFELVLIAFLSTAVVAFAVVGGQSLKAALGNPVDSLKHE